ncbi:MAG: elongation factor 1-alpha, partial [Thaumarchaeota archaeon]|nr:elongation factor 1-alpha [Nitrososphaerota archaeon]
MDEENDEGNIEYKYLLEPVSPEKAQKLVTQLRYRLDEGHGEAFYILGLMDDGRPIGLSHEKMEKSISNLRMLAQEAGASCRIIKVAKGQHGEIAEIYLRYIKGFLPIELTIALLGNVDAGKSTLKGVLVTGRLDDGNGGAMASVARYIHEIKMRRTSAISTHILGFDEEGDCINEYIQPYNEAEIYLKSS